MAPKAKGKAKTKPAVKPKAKTASAKAEQRPPPKASSNALSTAAPSGKESSAAAGDTLPEPEPLGSAASMPQQAEPVLEEAAPADGNGSQDAEQPGESGDAAGMDPEAVAGGDDDGWPEDKAWPEDDDFKASDTAPQQVETPGASGEAPAEASGSGAERDDQAASDLREVPSAVTSSPALADPPPSSAAGVSSAGPTGQDGDWPEDDDWPGWPEDEPVTSPASMAVSVSKAPSPAAVGKAVPRAAVSKAPAAPPAAESNDEEDWGPQPGSKYAESNDDEGPSADRKSWWSAASQGNDDDEDWGPQPGKKTAVAVSVSKAPSPAAAAQSSAGSWGSGGSWGSAADRKGNWATHDEEWGSSKETSQWKSLNLKRFGGAGASAEDDGGWGGSVSKKQRLWEEPEEQAQDALPTLKHQKSVAGWSWDLKKLESKKEEEKPQWTPQEKAEWKKSQWKQWKQDEAAQAEADPWPAAGGWERRRIGATSSAAQARDSGWKDWKDDTKDWDSKHTPRIVRHYEAAPQPTNTEALGATTSKASGAPPPRLKPPEMSPPKAAPPLEMSPPKAPPPPEMSPPKAPPPPPAPAAPAATAAAAPAPWASYAAATPKAPAAAPTAQMAAWNGMTSPAPVPVASAAYQQMALYQQQLAAVQQQQQLNQATAMMQQLQASAAQMVQAQEAHIQATRAAAQVTQGQASSSVPLREAATAGPAVASRPPKVYKEEDRKVGCRELLLELRDLAKKENMQDAKAIPNLAVLARTKYLPMVGPFHFHLTLGDAFEKAKFASHRKSILYVLHELLMGMRKTKLAAQEEDFLPTCLNLLERIGGKLREREGTPLLDEKERATYVNLVEHWERKKVFSRKDDLLKVKTWWPAVKS